MSGVNQRVNCDFGSPIEAKVSDLGLEGLESFRSRILRFGDVTVIHWL